MTHRFSRRNFLSTTVAGIGGILSCRIFPVSGEEYKGAWVDGKQINPAIDNLRVVNCTDPTMITADPVKWDIVSQNAPVVSERVRANIDAMACALAQKASPAEAWAVMKRIREPVMGCTHPAFLSMIPAEFGYQPSVFENIDFIKVEPA
jgi:hypothetical protein